ncbi:hypothetical protein JCM10207_005253 [Rhodosporidiobolus poonsookiae]
MLPSLSTSTLASDATSTEHDCALSVFSSSTASLDCAARAKSDDEDDDEQHGDAEPLLPQYLPRSPNLDAEAKGRRPSSRLGAASALLLTGVGALLFVFLGRGVTPSLPSFLGDSADLPPSSVVDETSPTSPQLYLLDPTHPNEGVIPFPSSLYSPLYRPAPLVHPLSTANWPSAACLAQYVASGTLCAAATGHWEGDNAPKMDVMWTWVNGSGVEPMAAWRTKVSAKVGLRARMKRWAGKAAQAVRKRAPGASVLRHFREHDELRYSIRSAVSSFPHSTLSTLHLVVGDTPAYLPGAPASPFPHLALANETTFSLATTRLAQVPRWAALDQLEFSEPRLDQATEGPRLRIHPHSGLFKTGGKGTGEDIVEEMEAHKWHLDVLPSFNSLAIESQLASLPDIAPTMLYLNDDFFLLQPLTISDIDSPLSGPVFRMQRDFLVHAVPPGKEHDDPEGEWRGLGYSAWLLDERFGKRQGRPYLAHIAKTLPPPLLKEVQQVFLKELTATASARFRGKAPHEVQTAFLAVMYIIEKHREALLWSFLVARSDTDRSGSYSPSERQAILSLIGFDTSSPTLSVSAPYRHTLSSLPSSRAAAGLPDPSQTRLEFSSSDGYAFFAMTDDVPSIPQRKPWPAFDAAAEDAAAAPVCTLDLSSCFGDAFLSFSGDIDVSAVFRRVAFEQPQCGDCLITLLVGKSGEQGLEAFLPPPNADAGEEGARVEAEAVALDGTRWEVIDFSDGLEGRGSLRQRAAALIHRYAYTIGDSPSSFQSLRSGGPALTARLNALSKPLGGTRPAFVALNDDVESVWAVGDVDRRLKGWMEETWPESSRWEVREEEAEKEGE